MSGQAILWTGAVVFLLALAFIPMHPPDMPA